MKPITLLMPVFGEAPYINETLDSIQLQDIDLFDLVVVIDRASGPTRETIRNFEIETELLVLESSKPGIVNALNLGLSKSKSEFIARIDADDIMMPDRLSRQLDEFRKNPGLVIVGSNVMLIDEAGTPLYTDYYPQLSNDIFRKLTQRNPFAHPAVMFRRESVLDAGGYREFYEGAEDYDLWTRLAYFGMMANLQENLTYYRVHENQVSKNPKTELAFLASLASYRLRLLNKPELHEKYENIYLWEQENDSKKNRLRRRTNDFLGPAKSSILKSKLISSFKKKSKIRLILLIAFSTVHPLQAIRKANEIARVKLRKLKHNQERELLVFKNSQTNIFTIPYLRRFVVYTCFSPRKGIGIIVGKFRNEIVTHIKKRKKSNIEIKRVDGNED